MKKNILLFTVVLLILAVSLSVPVFANENNEIREWECSDDLKTLYSGEIEYKLVDLPVGYTVMPMTIYVYSGNADVAHLIMSPYANAGIVMADIYGSDYNNTRNIYADDASITELEKLFSGESSSYYLFDNNYKISAYNPSLSETVADYTSGNQATVRSFDVMDLKYSLYCKILGYDGTNTVCFVSGAFYMIDNSLYYVDYTTLGNQYFDADGEFSYRKGTVDAYGLTEAIKDDIRETFESSKYYYPVYEYEEKSAYVYEYNDAFLIINLIFIVFIIPAVPFVFGLLVMFRKDHRSSKHWRILPILSIAWWVIGLTIMLIILL